MDMERKTGISNEAISKNIRGVISLNEMGSLTSEPSTTDLDESRPLKDSPKNRKF